MSRTLKIWLPAIRAGSGADVFVQRLAQGLERAGHEPCVQWFDHRYELMPWRLATFDAPEGTDVVHANSWQGFAFKRKGVPLVVTEHQYVAHPAFAPWQGGVQRLYHRWFIEPCMRRSYRVADAIVTVSEFCATAMRRDLKQPVEVIHNWVDAELFSPTEGGGRHDSTDGTIRLLFVGNPSRWKGADVVPALAAMLGDGYEIQCLGGLRKGFRRTALPANVQLLPRTAQEDMPDVYRSADMVLVPTRYEAFGYVALEAMSCGRPVVGFDCAGTAEICMNGVNALLAPMDDIDLLAGHIRRLAHALLLRTQMGVAGRLRATEHFKAGISISKYLNVYERALRMKH